MKLNNDDEAAQNTNQETDDDSHTPESIMTSATVDGTPFSVLMSQAIKIKSAQDAPTRSDYDKYPTFYKNSIFPRDEVINARQKPFVDRMADALKFKREGNQAFDEKRYFDAITKYEMALSVFKYLENVNQNWKTEGIRDDDIEEIAYTTGNLNEMEEVAHFLITCYVNIAVAALKGQMYKMVIEATDEVLEYDPTNVKSLYLKAKAIVAPKSSGSYEDEIAIKNLKEALKYDAKNKNVINELKIIMNRQRKQLKKDKAAFGGLFERGYIYHDGSGQEQADIYQDDHKSNSSDMHSKVDKIDFDNLSEVMVKKASDQGIDLKNPEVKKMLKQLQHEKLSQNYRSNEIKCTQKRLHYSWSKILSLLVIAFFIMLWVRKLLYSTRALFLTLY